MARTIFTIDGKSLALFGFFSTANAAVEPQCQFVWEVSFGVRSPVITWELEPAIAEYVLGQREVSVHFEAPGVKPLDVKRIVVIGKTKSTSKRRVAVQVGDIRRYLEYTNPVLAANVRAETGDNSTNGFDASGKFIRAIPAFAYRLYSVNADGSGLQAGQVVKRVMDLSSQSAQDWVLDGQPRATLLPNNIELFERGDVTVWRMLGMVGGLDLYVDPADGKMHVKNRVMGDEKQFIESRFSADGKGDTEGWGKIVDRDESHNRPSAFMASFDPRMEFRSNFVETAARSTTSALPKDEPWSENVAEVMEYRVGKYLAQTPQGPRQSLPGEYLAFGDYLSTMPNGPLVPSLSYTLLQKGFNNSNLIYGILGDGQIPDPGEEARIKSALTCYRTVLRLNRRWSSRCRPGTIQAVMAAVADAETGEPKPSDVYVDHCVIPTLETALGNNTNALQGWNRDSFPPLDTTANGSEKSYADGNGASPSLLSSMRVAPFNAKMLPGGSSSGLYFIEPRPDFQDERESIVPCRILNIPTLDYTAANNSLALFFWDQAPVAAQARATVILSAIPGVGQYLLPVSVSEAATRLGVAATPGKAPVKVVRLGQLPALFPWDDTKKQQIYDTFLGTFAGTDKDPLKTLVPSNQAVLQDYARGFFASILANYLDHKEGLQTGALDSAAKPVGSLHTITHRLGPKGSYTTTYNCMQVPDAFIADHFLSASTLAILRGRVTT